MKHASAAWILAKTRWLLAAFLLLGILTGANGLRNVRVSVPTAVRIGETVTLYCNYDLEEESLYTVKWYKGKKEFYRYVPKELPPTKVFPLPGVKVDVSSSDATQVVLRDVQLEMSGKYRCEVSADAPTFHTDLVVGTMNVVDFPEGEPELTVEKRRYAVGDMLRANCSSPRSNPTANITWLINGQSVNQSYVKTFPEVVYTGSRKRKAIVGLEFEIDGTTFHNSKLYLTCQVSIFTLYSDVRNVVLDEERPRLASVLGTRESSPGRGGVLRTGTHEWILCLSLLALAWGR